ncbi:hypothetical protein QZM22_00515 [Burkholderia oklahomensis]|uniref:hypothetical protein n=1 Tax=Burkholderia oklahomensis TaxID=342113 RepID=UPI00264DB5E4|nr:hypothetical protein [Burkholderia oklahomensis]MDN7671044.1 hypothetical protein [Burkholderia oklahomensis]
MKTIGNQHGNRFGVGALPGMAVREAACALAPAIEIEIVSARPDERRMRRPAKFRR